MPEVIPVRQTTEREPESERGTPPDTARHQNSPGAEAEQRPTPEVQTPDLEEMWRQYRERSDQLDGTTHLRLRGRTAADPHWCENALTIDGDQEVEEEAAEARKSFLQQVTAAERVREGTPEHAVQLHRRTSTPAGGAGPVDAHRASAEE